MHKWAKSIMECVKTKVDGIGMDNLDASNLCELEKWTCIAEKIAEYDYYYNIVKAMEESGAEYGKDYDYNGRYYTPRMRDSRGRYARGYHDDMYDMEHYRDMDRDSENVMYYTDMNMSNHNMGNMGRYDRARRGYEESKKMNPTMDNSKAIETIFDVLEDDMRELKNKMSSSEKEMTKERIRSLMNMI